MKKFLAMMLAMAMLLCGSAFAETTEAAEAAAVVVADPSPSFDVTAVLPEGMAILETVQEDDYTLVSIGAADDDAGLGFMLIMAPTEEYPDKSMADLTEDEKNAVLEALISDADAADYGLMTLENGREVMFYIERGESEIGNVIDIYDGYIIQLIYVRGNFDALLDSDVEAADAFMNTIAYAPVAAK